MSDNAAAAPRNSAGDASSSIEKGRLTDVFSIEELFQMPIKAVIDANAYAASVALNLIIEFGFNPVVEGGVTGDRVLGTLRMAKFVYDSVDDKGQRVASEISIPMLSLIPIPMLEVRTAQFHLAVRIISQDLREDGRGGSAAHPRRKLLAVMAPLETTGNKAPTTSSNQSCEANMEIKVELEKADLPAGILQLLNLGQEGIRSRHEASVEMRVAPESLFFQRDQDPQLEIKVFQPAKPGVEPLPVPGAEVTIGVSIGWGPSADELFAAPIKVVTGYLVGAPRRVGVIVRTNEQGEAKVRFFPSFAETTDGWNGFVKVRVAGESEQKVYFSFPTKVKS
jgi:hypothetical protein